MRILVICDRDWTHPLAGGAGLNLGSQVERWLADGHNVKVFTVRHSGAPSYERHGDLEIRRRGWIFSVFPWSWVEELKGIASDVDVVLEIINGVPWLSKFITGKPTVAMIHHVCQQQFDREFSEPFKSIGKFIEARMMPRLYANVPFITVSETSRADLVSIGISAEKITIIHNGLDPAAYVTDTPRADLPTLVFLGRLKAYKRIDLLLRMFRRMVDYDSRLRLDLVGDGDDRPRLEELTRTLGLATNVTFIGFASETEKVTALARAWVSVTASDVEGWGLSIMEGAACSTPAVAFNCSGLAESVLHGKTGFLATDEDEFVASCLELLENRDLRDQMGRNAREWASEFDWGRTADDTISVLAKAAERHELTTAGRFEVHRPAASANPSALDVANRAQRIPMAERTATRAGLGSDR